MFDDHWNILPFWKSGRDNPSQSHINSSLLSCPLTTGEASKAADMESATMGSTAVVLPIDAFVAVGTPPLCTDQATT